jgi:nicotinamide mononucleotide transporter PnuC
MVIKIKPVKLIKELFVYLVPIGLIILILGLLLKLIFDIHISSLETVGVIFNVLSIILIRKRNYFGWLLAIVSNIFIAVFAINNTVYAQAVLQIVFFMPTSLYAFKTWRRSLHDRIYPEDMDSKNIILAIIFLILIFLLFLYILPYKDKFIHVLDVAALAFIVVGHISLILKKRQSWLFFIPGDVFASILFYLINGYFLLGLNIFFCINSFLGFIEWRKNNNVIQSKKN